MEKTPEAPPKRRLSGGRRRSIIVPVEGLESPVVVDAPPNESLQGNTFEERMAGMEARMDALRRFEEKQLAEEETWDAMMQKHSDRVVKIEKAPESDERKVERLVNSTGLRATYVVNQTRQSVSSYVENEIKTVQKGMTKLYAEEQKYRKQEDTFKKSDEKLRKIYAEQDPEYPKKKKVLFEKMNSFVNDMQNSMASFYKQRGIDVENYNPNLV